MFRIISMILALTLLSFPIYAESWYRLVLYDEISIEVPKNSDHKVIDLKNEAYLSTVDGCSFMIGIVKGAFDNRGNYLSWSEEERVNNTLSLFEGILQGKLTRGNQQLISKKAFQTGKYIGMDIVYRTKASSDPDSRKRFVTFIAIENTLYMFECWYMDGKDHTKEKEKFFGSMRTKYRH
ncbi:hypothetical protein AB6805_13740 [Chitinophaga sp. RCC_12]|uniref:hypothetical protein n=1 Tax=Chitinophaga sp. RCC_12 TaxID=3239226 RepID=UPI00352431A8